MMAKTEVQHETTVQEVGPLKQASCSCGWKGRHFDGELAAQREADAHTTNQEEI